MDLNNEPMSPETFNNFNDFNNMFKGIDSDCYTPDQIATIIVRKIELKGNQARLDDAIRWFDDSYFHKIRHTMDEAAHERAYDLGLSPPEAYDSEGVSDIED